MTSHRETGEQYKLKIGAPLLFAHDDQCGEQARIEHQADHHQARHERVLRFERRVEPDPPVDRDRHDARPDAALFGRGTPPASLALNCASIAAM